MLVFEGDITGVGTTSGHRLVVGRWQQSPFGAFADVMHEAPDGHRRLLAPSAEVADFIAATYEFDEIVIGPVVAERSDRRLRVEAGDLHLTVELGGRTTLGWLLRAVPPPLAHARWWCAAIDPVAFEDPADTGPYRLVSRHGSLTGAEMRVPLLALRND